MCNITYNKKQPFQQQTDYQERLMSITPALDAGDAFIFVIWFYNF